MAFVERVSRLVLIAALPDGRGTASTTAAVANLLSRQPQRMAKTLTWDQGREMAHWHKIEDRHGRQGLLLRTQVSLAAPQQRTNHGLLRRWLPKGTDLNISPITLGRIKDELNFMPRKLHD